MLHWSGSEECLSKSKFILEITLNAFMHYVRVAGIKGVPVTKIELLCLWISKVNECLICVLFASHHVYKI